jgi:glutamate synthase (NADPH/NADH) large chain
MRTREHLLECDVFSKEEIEMFMPICYRDQSDSASLDNVVELLYLAGRSSTTRYHDAHTRSLAR